MQDEEKLLKDIQSIMLEANNSSSSRKSRQPSQLLDHLYLGDRSDADSLGMLSELSITHVLNCAGACSGFLSGHLGGGATSIRAYQALDAEDTETYDMLQHFNSAKQFIDGARECGGKVLVHCARGINRSVTICVAYLMVDQQMDLRTAVRSVAKVRGNILKNIGFQKQLIRFAQSHSYLTPN